MRMYKVVDVVSMCAIVVHCSAGFWFVDKDEWLMGLLAFLSAAVIGFVWLSDTKK